VPDWRVLHVITDLDQGGAQEALCVLAEQPGARDRMLVCTLRDGPLRSTLQAAGVRVFVVPGPACRFWNVPAYARELGRISGALRAVVDGEHVDIVQTHLLNVFDLLVLALKRGRRTPAVVWTFHGPDYLPARPGALLHARRAACQLLYRVLASRVDAIVCVSDDIRRQVLTDLPGAPPERVSVIGNVPSPRKWAGARPRAAVRAELACAPDALVVLCAGRLAAVKGIDRIIAAAPAVIANVPDVVFQIAGAGPEHDALVAEAERLGVAARVRFLGTRDDVADLLGAADVFCLPSRYEGRSVALLEAMSAGVPIVASDLPANREVIEHGVTGILVDAGHVAALAAALSRVLLNPDEGRRIGRAAAEAARARYRLEAQRAAYDALYDDVGPVRVAR
jgi:glycosyltransferase involved in cell wall biosynthesis